MSKFNLKGLKLKVKDPDSAPASPTGLAVQEIQVQEKRDRRDSSYDIRDNRDTAAAMKELAERSVLSLVSLFGLDMEGSLTKEVFNLCV